MKNEILYLDSKYSSNILDEQPESVNQPRVLSFHDNKFAQEFNKMAEWKRRSVSVVFSLIYRYKH